MKTFEKIELMPALQRALVDNGYEIPTPIQSQTIPAALQGRDILGCARTGTGKTAAFALPLLNRLGKENRKAKPNHPVALVLAPTRELAIQIEESFASYGRHLRLRLALIYGGVGQAKQVRALNQGAHIVVATPGRLLDLMNQGHIKLNDLQVFTLDEADRMLDMGFLPDLKRIIRHLPSRRQSLFFSATMPPKIVELSSRLLTNPVHVHVAPKTTNVGKIKQQVLFVDRADKMSVLQDILDRRDVKRTIVFTRTKRTANRVAERLVKNGMHAAAIHGNKSQNARQRALESFRTSRIDVLVATDVAARGIDIDGITHVVNYDLPVEPEAYVHRIGRTGRAGADGIAISFCCQNERAELIAIERLIGRKIQGSRPKSKSPGGASRVRSEQRRGGTSAGSSSGKKNVRSSASRDRNELTTGKSMRKRRPKPRRNGTRQRKRASQSN